LNYQQTAFKLIQLTIFMPAKTDSGRPVTVRLTAKEVKCLDGLAAKSGMTRHRYMSFVLDRAMQSGLVVRERVEFSESVTSP
jgi:predicted DNA binding CopG/RHH family protein